MLSALSPTQKRKRPTRYSFPDEIPETPRHAVDTSSPPPTDTNTAPPSPGRRLIFQMRGMQLDELQEVAIVEDEAPENMDMELHPAVKRRRSSADLDDELDDGDTEMDMEKTTDARGKETGKVVMIAERSTANRAGSSGRMRSPPPESSNTAEVQPVMDRVMDTSKQDEDFSEADIDGYGIAYAPTPQQRDLRRQKRLQQIRDYKTRESREARQRRIEQRRRRRSSSHALNGSVGSGQKKDSSDEGRKKSVHFRL